MPQRRTAPRPASGRQHSRTSSSRKRKPLLSNQKEKIIVFVLLGVAAILLTSVIIAASILLSKPSSSDLIPNNVFAAGVNLGGMTEVEAKKALNDATQSTYSKLEMTIQVLDTSVTLSPKSTGAKLNVNAVVDAAMSSNDSTTVSVLPYLNLDTSYIRKVVDELGKKYSSTLTQGSITVEGTKPPVPQDSYDTETTYQTLVVYMGTAEYGLSTDDLYDQVMDAYDMNLFQVVGQCSVIAPDPLSLDNYYQDICTEPVDASLDTTTYEVSKESYGYGFDLNKANEMMASAKYGDTLRIPIRFIKPDITAEMLTSDLFRDKLAEVTTVDQSKNSDLHTNLKLACKAINGQLIKVGENFSFSQAIGQPSVGKGYRSVQIYQGTKLTDVIGGGISQVATTLYNCALLADLDIVERHAHSYAPSYIDPGLDAMVSWGSADLIFTNTTNYPIRIEAELINNSVVIQLIGTNNSDYYVSLETEVVEHKPSTLHQSMLEDNIGGYKQGDILIEGISGYDVIVYRNQNEKETNRQMSQSVLSYDRYEKRNQVVVDIYVPPIETEPTTESETETESEPETSTSFDGE